MITRSLALLVGLLLFAGPDDNPEQRTEDQRQLLTTLMQQRYPDTLLLQGNLDAA